MIFSTRSATRRPWALIAALFIVAGGTYVFSAVLLGRTSSPTSAYFDALADAFLHGRLFLDNPASTQDLTQHAGRWYVPFPPLPALLLVPWVAVRGLANTNTVLFGALVGATNVVLAFLMLRALALRGWSQLVLADNLWLVALLAFGSVHWYMSTLGSVWFLAQICTLTGMLAAVWLAVGSGNALGAGTALALAALGRPTVVLLYPLLVAIGAQHHKEGRLGGRSVFSWALLALVPLVIAGLLLMAYNYARFGNPLDFGYLTQNVVLELEGDLHQYGQFNIHYVPHNLWVMLFAGPVWDARRHTMLPTIDGMSLLLTTPALLFLFRERPRSVVTIGAWVALGLLLVPLITYYNTGWWQFGYRFILDAMAPILVLLAVSAGAQLGWRMRLLIVIGIVVNAWGCWWFLNPRFFS